MSAAARATKTMNKMLKSVGVKDGACSSAASGGAESSSTALLAQRVRHALRARLRGGGGAGGTGVSASSPVIALGSARGVAAPALKRFKPTRGGVDRDRSALSAPSTNADATPPARLRVERRAPVGGAKGGGCAVAAMSRRVCGDSIIATLRLEKRVEIGGFGANRKSQIVVVFPRYTRTPLTIPPARG